MEPKTLLDTDVLSGLMRKSPSAWNRARVYLADHRRLTIALVTRFEILRGLKAKRVTAQLAAFDAFCANNEVLPMVAWLAGVWLMLLAVPVGVCVLGFDAIRVLSPANPMMAVKVGLVMFAGGAGLFTVGQLTRRRTKRSGPNETTTQQKGRSTR